jgi:hypothetical protein
MGGLLAEDRGGKYRFLPVFIALMNLGQARFIPYYAPGSGGRQNGVRRPSQWLESALGIPAEAGYILCNLYI